MPRPAAVVLGVRRRPGPASPSNSVLHRQLLQRRRLSAAANVDMCVVNICVLFLSANSKSVSPGRARPPAMSGSPTQSARAPAGPAAAGRHPGGDKPSAKTKGCRSEWRSGAPGPEDLHHWHPRRTARGEEGGSSQRDERHRRRRRAACPPCRPARAPASTACVPPRARARRAGRLGVAPRCRGADGSSESGRQ